MKIILSVLFAVAGAVTALNAMHSEAVGSTVSAEVAATLRGGRCVKARLLSCTKQNDPLCPAYDDVYKPQPGTNVNLNLPENIYFRFYCGLGEDEGINAGACVAVWNLRYCECPVPPAQ